MPSGAGTHPAVTSRRPSAIPCNPAARRSRSSSTRSAKPGPVSARSTDARTRLRRWRTIAAVTATGQSHGMHDAGRLAPYQPPPPGHREPLQRRLGNQVPVKAAGGSPGCPPDSGPATLSDQQVP